MGWPVAQIALPIVWQLLAFGAGVAVTALVAVAVFWARRRRQAAQALLLEETEGGLTTIRRGAAETLLRIAATHAADVGSVELALQATPGGLAAKCRFEPGRRDSDLLAVARQLRETVAAAALSQLGIELARVDVEVISKTPRRAANKLAAARVA